MIKTAIVLAGGKGTRLKSVVEDLPKPMALVNEKPFLTLLLDYLIVQGIQEVILAVGYLHQVIINEYGDEYKALSIKYSIENQPLGTGGAIKKAVNLSSADDILVVNGDTFIAFNLKPLQEFYLSKKKEPILLLKKMQDFERYGVVEINKDFSVAEFKEKQYCAEGYINAGVYMINKSIFKEIESTRFSFEKEILESKTNKFSWSGFPQDAYFRDIGIPEDYFQFIEDDKNQIFSSVNKIDESWTLFLDRDGVINKRKVGGYIEHNEEFEFLGGVKDAIARFTKCFGKIIVITNQQGIGKGLFSDEALGNIHKRMKSEIEAAGGRIDGIYYCGDLKSPESFDRKPNTGMAIQAKKDFPAINFIKSIMIGDSPSDIQFGKRMGMHCIGIGDRVKDCSDLMKHTDALANVNFA